MENFWKREMIQEFSVTNFLSFKDKTTISFLATDDRKDKDILTYSPRRGVHLLRAAMLIGANASGKSNLLRAMGALRDIATIQGYTSNADIPFTPFALSKNKPTEFEITFWYNYSKYEYKIHFNGDMILYESLVSDYTDDESEILFFERKVENKNKQTIILDESINESPYTDKVLEVETPTHCSLLSSFLHNYYPPKIILNAIRWFDENFYDFDIETPDFDIDFADYAISNPEIKSYMISLLQKADINIVDFEIITIRDRYSFSRNKTQNYDNHLIFKHKTDSGETFSLDSSLESDGTKIYFELAKILYSFNEINRVLLIDEIDKSLHYDLLLHFLEIFLTNHNSSQLIFTTHNIALLEEEWWYRSDMLWIVEKDRETSSSTLTRASDYDFPKRLSLAQAYKVGRLGGKPDLGSTIIGLPNNEQ